MKQHLVAALIYYHKHVADIGGQKDGTMQSAKPLLNCENRQQNSGKTEHDWNISEKQVGRHGKRHKKATESKHHEKIK